MSERHAFDGPAGIAHVALPFSLDALLADWRVLRRRMVRAVPAAYTRDEWATLLTFVDPAHLEACFVRSFGPRSSSEGTPTRMFRPRGEIAIWLPNNVSLLGPLSLLLASLTGQPIGIKLGSRADDLVQPLLDLLQDQSDLHTLSAAFAGVRAERFGRSDPRNADMARRAPVRMAFGSDAAVHAILSQPGPIRRRDLAFADRSSVAWLEPAALDDARIDQLIRMFALYGRDGCTSPRTAVLVDGTEADLSHLVSRLQARWPALLPEDVPVHLASEASMSAQWGRALGLKMHTIARRRAVLVEGPAPDGFGSSRVLELRCVPRAQLVEALPGNIQTIGHALVDPSAAEWSARVAASSAARFVPLLRMHHFGIVWDGWSLLRELFEEVEFTCR